MKSRAKSTSIELMVLLTFLAGCDPSTKGKLTTNQAATEPDSHSLVAVDQESKYDYNFLAGQDEQGPSLENAQAKCRNYYPPQNGRSSAAKFEACTHMMMADYYNEYFLHKDKFYTFKGTLIEFIDDESIKQLPSNLKYFYDNTSRHAESIEAIWGENGALCISRPRWRQLHDRMAGPTARLPDCYDCQHDQSHPCWKEPLKGGGLIVSFAINENNQLWTLKNKTRDMVAIWRTNEYDYVADKITRVSRNTGVSPEERISYYYPEEEWEIYPLGYSYRGTYNPQKSFHNIDLFDDDYSPSVETWNGATFISPLIINVNSMNMPGKMLDIGNQSYSGKIMQFMPDVSYIEIKLYEQRYPKDPIESIATSVDLTQANHNYSELSKNRNYDPFGKGFQTSESLGYISSKPRNGMLPLNTYINVKTKAHITTTEEVLKKLGISSDVVLHRTEGYIFPHETYRK